MGKQEIEDKKKKRNQSVHVCRSEPKPSMSANTRHSFSLIFKLYSPLVYAHMYRDTKCTLNHPETGICTPTFAGW